MGLASAWQADCCYRGSVSKVKNVFATRPIGITRTSLPHNILTKVRSHAEWRFRPPRIDSVRHLQRVGSEYGGYFVDMQALSAKPVIYSLGVGEDISFDLALIESCACTIYAFDPTPRVQSWIASQTLPPQFHFVPIGIANFDGEADFYLPPSSEFVSHSLLNVKEYSKKSIRVPMMTLLAAMTKFGHKEIDVLKMDIEGAEYSVLADLVRERVDVRQIIVEFHHRLSHVGISETRNILSTLRDYGMKLCYVCPRLEVMTFVRETVLRQR